MIISTMGVLPKLIHEIYYLDYTEQYWQDAAGHIAVITVMKGD